MSEFWTTTRPKARKQHGCESCNRTIPAGENYRRDSGLYDGEFTSFATCNQCESFMRELHARGIDDWNTGGFISPRDVYWQDVADLLDVRLLRALVLFRRRWTHRDGSIYQYPAEVSS